MVPAPNYYGLLFVKQVVGARHLSISGASNSDLFAHAVVYDDNSKGIVLLNRNKTQSATVTVNGNIPSSHEGALIRLKAPRVSYGWWNETWTQQSGYSNMDYICNYKDSVTLGGVSVSGDGTVPNFQWESVAPSGGGYTVTVSPTSAVLLRVSDGTVALDRNSVQNDQDLGISVSPNPFRTSVDISVRHPSHVARYKVRLGVFNIAGKMVTNIKSRATSDERRATSYKWHAQDQPAGIYLVKVKIGNSILTKKVTLMR
jgi:hypothetical protein